jgi:hypothetical protein
MGEAAGAYLSCQVRGSQVRGEKLQWLFLLPRSHQMLQALFKLRLQVVASVVGHRLLVLWVLWVLWVLLLPEAILCPKTVLWCRVRRG